VPVCPPGKAWYQFGGISLLGGLIPKTGQHRRGDGAVPLGLNCQRPQTISDRASLAGCYRQVMPAAPRLIQTPLQSDPKVFE
jgi:hypothetical protein